MSALKTEFHAFLNAFTFYTRIPCPLTVPYSPELMARSTRYLPSIGLFIGALSGAAFWCTEHFLGLHIAALVALLVPIWLTGAFHEDGFADFCDGIGGGWDKDRILEIMKDSRLGTYGAIGLLLLLASKFLLIVQVAEVRGLSSLPLILLLAHSLSRFIPLTVMASLDYARKSDSKAKSVAVKPSGGDLIFAGVCGLLPLTLVLFSGAGHLGWMGLLGLLIGGLVLVRAYMLHKMKRWMGGYTGDSLGALQQASEVVIYLAFAL